MNVVDKHRRYKCQQDNNPSFSSTLLDVIYRSIDERVDDDDEEGSASLQVYNKNTIMGKQQFSFNNCFQVEKQNIYRNNNNIIGSSCLETTDHQTSIYGFPTRLRPIRTSSINTNNTKTTSANIMYKQQHLQEQNAAKKNVDVDDEGINNYNNNKSRAMKKIYGYLKRSSGGGKQQQQQPIYSPGGGRRLASYLVSLFTTTTTNNNKKKSNMMSSACTGRNHDDVIHRKRSSSSSSSWSNSARPPRGNTKSSFSNNNNNVVRFDYPPRDSRFDHDSSLSAVFMDRDRSCILQERTTTRRNYCVFKNKFEYYNVFDDFITIYNNNNNNNVVNKEEDDDEKGSSSYASSDLFELQDHHLINSSSCANGIDVMKELPLYGTTSVAANTAIANGFLV